MSCRPCCRETSKCHANHGSRRHVYCGHRHYPNQRTRRTSTWLQSPSNACHTYPTTCKVSQLDLLVKGRTRASSNPCEDEATAVGSSGLPAATLPADTALCAIGLDLGSRRHDQLLGSCSVKTKRTLQLRLLDLHPARPVNRQAARWGQSPAYPRRRRHQLLLARTRIGRGRRQAQGQLMWEHRFATTHLALQAPIGTTMLLCEATDWRPSVHQRYLTGRPLRHLASRL